MRLQDIVSTVDQAKNLFLTSKVRLHCDKSTLAQRDHRPEPFPDLKGQAPLRHDKAKRGLLLSSLFLTSKVRLHCDGFWEAEHGSTVLPFS